MKRLLKITLTMLLALTGFAVKADDFVVVAKESKIFDGPSVKDYPTRNVAGEEILLKGGMVFKVESFDKGWYLIEYSPGLRAYLAATMVATDKLAIPSAGLFKVANVPGEVLNFTKDGDSFKASLKDKTFKGERAGNAIVFRDESGNIAFSLAVLNGVPYAWSYSNDATKFF